MFNKKEKNRLGDLENRIKGLLNDIEIEKFFNDTSDSFNNIRKVKDIYKEIFGGSLAQNPTSTVLIHYPLTPMSNFLLLNAPCHSIAPYKNSHYTQLGAVSVLTGDAEFDDKMTELMANELRRYDGIKILQIPHHGSKRNWDKLSIIKYEFDVFVISFGYGNSHTLPNAKVVKDLRSLNYIKTFMFATQTSPVVYVIED